MKDQNIQNIWLRKEIDSPCVKLCSIHPTEQICVGCYRSMEEIGAWSSLSSEVRLKIMSELPSRAFRIQKRRGGRGAKVPSLK